MAEIKSTLDLIMERTAGMGLSEQEKAELKTEERRRKARGLAVRLLEGGLGPAALEREISSWKGEERERQGRELVWELISLADLERLDKVDLSSILEVILGEKGDLILEGLQEAGQRYKAEAAKAAATEVAELLKKLEARGIRGSSLKPRVHGGLDQTPFKSGLKGIIFPAREEG